MRKMNGVPLSFLPDGDDEGFRTCPRAVDLNRHLDKWLQENGHMSNSEIAFRDRVAKGQAKRWKKKTK